MKNKFLVLLMLLILPITGKCLTPEEKLDKIKSVKEGDTYYIDVKSLDPDIILGDTCNITKEELIKRNSEYYSNMSNEELNSVLLEEKHYCLNYYYTFILGLHLKKNGVENLYNDYVLDYTDKNNVKISVYDDNNQVSRNYKLRYIDNYDKSVLSGSNKVKNELKDVYTIYGLSVLNSIYHYGNIEENIYQNDLVLYRFSDLKDTINKYSDYEIIPRLQGAGGTPSINANEGALGIFKNDILYALSKTSFEMNHVLYVDKDESGTAFSKAEKRISDYFKGTVNVEVDKENFDLVQDEYLDDEINEYLGTQNVSYVGTFTKVKLDDKETLILIVEIPKDKLDKVDIQTKDYKTGINISTSSYQVPIDVTLLTQDVINNDLVKKASEKSDINFVNAYDINLLKTSNGGYVTKIEDGVVVYMPLSGSYKENDKVDVYYIKDDGTLEKLEGSAVLVGDDLFVKFITNHFSTYAVGNEIIKNPNTIDNVYIYLIIGLASMTCLGYIVYKKIKN